MALAVDITGLVAAALGSCIAARRFAERSIEASWVLRYLGSPAGPFGSVGASGPCIEAWFVFASAGEISDGAGSIRC